MKEKKAKTISDVHGLPIPAGAVVIVQCGNKEYLAEFSGFTDRGAAKFKSLFGKKDLNLMPKSVEKIYPFGDLLNIAGGK